MSTFRSPRRRTTISMDILPPERVSKAGRMAPARGEVVDAQFVTLGERSPDRPRRRFQNDNKRQPGRIAKRRSLMQRWMVTAELRLRNLSADVFTAAVAVLFSLVLGLSGGFTFLFSAPDAGTPTSTFDITHVTMTPQEANGLQVLLINGIVQNMGNERLTMPSIRADLLAGDQLVASTLISPPASSIEGGQSRGFSVRLPRPGGKVPDLRLSLAERGV